MRITFLGHAGCFVETRHGSVLCDPWFTPAYFGSWFPFPRNDGLDPERVRRRPTTSTSRTSTAITSIREWLARHVRQAGAGAAPRVRRRPPRSGSCGALGFHDFVRTRHGERVDLDGLGVTILAMTSPADGPLGDSRDRARRRHRPGPEPERRPARRPRRAARARPVRRAARCSSPARSGTRSPTTSRPRRRSASPATKRVDEMARAAAVHRGGRRRARVPVRRTALLPRRRPLRAQRPRPRSRPTSSPTRRCSSTSSRRTGSTAAHLVVPGSVDRPRRPATCKVTPSGRRRGDRAPFTDKRAYLERVPRTTGRRGSPPSAQSWSHARSRSRRRARGVVRAAARARRRSRRPASRATSCSTSVIPAADVCIDFVESEVRPWTRRAVRLQGRRRPRADRGARSTTTSRTG